MPPPLLCIHLWYLETFTVVVYRGCSRFIFCATAIVNTFVTQKLSAAATPSLRCNPPSLSKGNQHFAQQQLSAFTAGAISLQHSRRFNCPSSEHEQLPLDQQAQPVLAKQAQPASHSRCNEPSPSKRIQSSFTADSYSQLGCHRHLRRFDNHRPKQRVTSVYNDAATISPLRHGPRISRGCVDID